MADTEGVQGVRSNPPLELNYFISMGNFRKNEAKLRKRTPLSEFEPPIKKSWRKRNIRVHNKDLKSLKSVAYKTLVRPQLEYASTVWYPHHDKDINKVEAVQRRAARWVIRDYKYTSSVTAMLKDLNWRPLDQRRIESRLLMMYKVTYDLVAIPAPEYLV